MPTAAERLLVRLDFKGVELGANRRFCDVLENILIRSPHNDQYIVRSTFRNNWWWPQASGEEPRGDRDVRHHLPIWVQLCLYCRQIGPVHSRSSNQAVRYRPDTQTRLTGVLMLVVTDDHATVAHTRKNRQKKVVPLSKVKSGILVACHDQTIQEKSRSLRQIIAYPKLAQRRSEICVTSG